MRLSGPLAACVLAAGCSSLRLDAGGSGSRGMDVARAASAARDLRAAMDLGPEDEARLGREVAANLTARYGLLADEGLTRYVSLVGLTVARKASRPEIRYRFGVLNTVAVNAYAAPGGYIFVTRGLLKKLRSEAELAGVLAHEIAHVDERHALKALSKAKALEASAALASSRSNGGRQHMFDLASAFLINLLEKGFSRQDEYAADESGVSLAAAAGYDAGALPRALERLYGGSGDKDALPFQKRHPALRERLGALSKPLARVPASGASLQKRFLDNVAF